jgi:hypothetical protein
MKSFLSILFLVLILGPIGGRLVGFEYTLVESRARHTMPDFSMARLLDSRFYEDFDRYFNDNFSLRGAMIYLKNRIDYSVFRTSPTKDVHVGREGWVFYRPSLNEYNRHPHRRRSEVEKVFLHILGLEKLVLASGRQFVCTVAPNKCSIYPEYVGYAFRRPNGRPGSYDVFLDLNEKHPLGHFVRLDTLLKEASASRLVYDRTDSHWNYDGAAIASRAMLNAVFPGSPDERMPEYSLGEITAVRDLTGRLMNLPIKEDVIVLNECRYPYNVKQETVDAGPRRTPLIRFKSSAPEPGPRCLFYRDSFAGRMVPFLKGAFRNALLLPWVDGVPSRGGAERIREYDLVMLEIVERNLRDVTIRLGPFLMALEEDLDPSKRTEVPVDRLPAVESDPQSQSRSFRVSAIKGSGENAFRILCLHRGIDVPGHVLITSSDNAGSKLSEVKVAVGPGEPILAVPLPFAEVVHVEILSSGEAPPLESPSAYVWEFSQETPTG